MRRIAIMQPYFLPYPGYFRLMAGVDAFVASDLRQLPGRGWVNRNRLRDDLGRLAWLTLPLRPHPLTTQIRDTAFAADADRIFSGSMCRFPACRTPNDHTAPIVARMRRLEPDPTGLIIDLLRDVADLLDLPVPLIRQSELHLPEHLPKAELIYAVCEALGAKEYVNAPGGRHLYDGAEFRRRGLRLLFLPPYEGDHASILQRLADAAPGAIRQEILANTRHEGA